MANWVPAVFAIIAGAVIADRVRRDARRSAESQKPSWGVPRLAEGDPYADEYWRFANAEPGAALDGIDDRTWDDLDLNDVVRSVDRTRSTLGRQLLYARLRWGTDAADPDRLQRVARTISDGTAPRAAVNAVFDKFDADTGQNFWRITRDKAIAKKAWYHVFPFLTSATVASIVLTFFNPAFFFVIAIAILLNAWVRAATAKELIAHRSAFAQVAPILGAARRLNAIPSIADASVSADLAELVSLERPARWMSRDPAEVGEFVAAINEYLNLLLVIDANALLFAAGSLQRSRQALIRVSAWVGDVDLALSIASLRAEPRPWCVPTHVADSAPMTLTGAWHPMLADPVPTSFSLARGEGLVVTGSNMSGKSTFLRTVGVCTVLANGIGTCPAASYAAPAVRTRACIGRADSLAEGRSYYLTEVERVLDIVRTAEAPGRHLFLFDELFRGTNTVERIAAGEAVLRDLVRDPQQRAVNVIVATHDGELVTLLSDAYRAVHFEEHVSPDGLTFDYQLRPGPATTRSAIALLELQGAPSRVVHAARVRADSLTAMQAK